MFDGGLPAAVGPGDGDDVEAGAAFEQIVPLEIDEGRFDDALLLALVDCFRRMAGSAAGASLDLDENDGATIDGDQVDLAAATALAAGDDDIAPLPEISGGSSFTALAERLPRENRLNASLQCIEPAHDEPEL